MTQLLTIKQTHKFPLQHPFILSHLVQVLKLKLTDIGKLSTYLVQEMPWAQWQPTGEDDLATLFTWLRCPINSIENNTARVVLSQLNWEFGALPVNHHVCTAITVVEVFTNYVTSIINQG